MVRKLLALSLSFLLLLCGCAKSEETPSARTPVYDENGIYAGFSDIPEEYNVWSAYHDGCLSIDAGIEVDQQRLTAGRTQWQAFLDAASRGENAFLRVAHFIQNVGSYTDLYYCDGVYTMFHLDERGITHGNPWTLLRKLESGGKGKPYYVLTDSMELTYHDVSWSFLSSDLSSITKIPYEWLGFMVYFE